MKKNNTIPLFKTEDEEKDFWATHSLADYADNLKPVHLHMPHLKPSTKTISIRISESMLYQLKKLANKKDVPYQSLVKLFLSQKIKEESITA